MAGALGEFITAIFLPTFLNGLVFAISLSLVALGLSIIFGLMGVINFAHGEFFMMAGYFAYTVIAFMGNFWIALLTGMIMLAAIGIGVEALTLRPIYARPAGHLLTLIITFGAAMFLREFTRFIYGVNPYNILDPIGLTITLPGGEHYPVYALFILFTGIAIYIVLWLFFGRTKAGAIVRAAYEDSEMLSCLGVNVRRLFTVLFGFSAALAGLAGVIMTPRFNVTIEIGITMIIWAFVVVIIGGMGSIGGTIIASVLVGEASALGSIWLEPREMEIIIMAMVVLVLILRPRGLFGRAGILE